MANKKVRTGFELQAHSMDLARKLLDSLKQMSYSDANSLLDKVGEELETHHQNPEGERPIETKPKSKK